MGIPGHQICPWRSTSTHCPKLPFPVGYQCEQVWSIAQALSVSFFYNQGSLWKMFQKHISKKCKKNRIKPVTSRPADYVSSLQVWGERIEVRCDGTGGRVERFSLALKKLKIRKWKFSIWSKSQKLDFDCDFQN